MGNYARELIREALEKPHRLLEEKKFWKLTVFQEFLKEITARLLKDGQGALELALLGPAFAELVAAHDGTSRNTLLVRAYGRLGSACRVVGRYEDADAAYDKADKLTAPAIEHADTDRRRAYLRVYQGRPAEGHDFAHRAVEVYKQSDDHLLDRHDLGLALAARGYTHYYNGRSGAAVDDLTTAVAMINYRTKPRTYYYALHNLTLFMFEAIHPDRLDQILRNLDACYSRFVGYSQRHMAKYKIRWLQAQGLKKFAATRQAERYFKKAFNGFVELEAASEVAMISIDLGILFVEEGRFQEAKDLAQNAYKIASGLGMSSGGLAALALWKQADDEQLTTKFLLEVRAKLIDHVEPFGGVTDPEHKQPAAH